MARPRALDLFCGGGGVSVGLARAGFEVTGVDLNAKAEATWRRGMAPHGGGFVCADALSFPLDGYAFIWASPPCQAFSALRLSTGRAYPDLLVPIRERLRRQPAQWVIENVPGAPLRFAFTLCGGAFGLAADGPDGIRRSLRRHRLFESSIWGLAAPACRCDDGEKVGVYGGSDGGKAKRRGGRRGGYQGTMAEKRQAMEIDWMPLQFINQAIPPAYAEWIGRQALQVLEAHPAAS